MRRRACPTNGDGSSRTMAIPSRPRTATARSVAEPQAPAETPATTAVAAEAADAPTTEAVPAPPEPESDGAGAVDARANAVRRGGPGAPRRCRGRDGARQGVPDARSPRGPARSARLRADGRPCARRDAAASSADSGAPGADPGSTPPALRPGGHAARGAAAPARGLHGLDRLRDRAHLGPRRARVAAQGDRVGALPRDAAVRAAHRAPAAALAGRGLRAVPPALVPRAEAVLARGPRRPRADARRGDRARRRGRGARGRDRDGPPRPAQRPRPHGRSLVRVGPARVRGRALLRRARRRPRRRER